MRYTASLLLASLVVALVAACGGGGGGGDIPANAVATVDGDPVLRRDVNTLLNQACRSYKQQKRPCPKAGTPEYLQLQNQAVQFLVQRIQYEQKADELGVDVTDKQVDARLKQIKKQYFGGSEKRYREALKKQGLTEAQVRKDIRAQLVSEGLFKKVSEVDDAAIRAHYDKNKKQYAQPSTREVRHILVKARPLADRLYTQLCGPAQRCLKQLATANFPGLAKRHSIDPGSKATGGKLTVTRGQTVPEFDRTAFALLRGETSHPVKTQFGFHIIQALSKVSPPKTTPYEQVKQTIKQQLGNEKATKFIEGLKKEYEGKIKYAKGYEPPPTTTGETATATTG